jgi:2-(1,2-epoxy-1,2-dihydrophenyl)acetyl-CoA isomerase
VSDLLIDIRDGVATLTINREAQRNTVGGTLFKELLEAAEALDNDDAVRAVVVTANGPFWCSSSDVANLGDWVGQPVDDLLHSPDFGGDMGLPVLSGQARRFDRLGIGRWVLRFQAIQKPLIAAMNGSAAAGGLSLALLHDVRIAAEGARFKSAFLSVGVGPEMGLSWTLPRVVGQAMATRMLLEDFTMDAAAALECGLVHRVLPAEQVLGAAQELAARLAAAPPLAVRATIRALRATGGHTFEEQLMLEWDNQRICIASEDAGRALKALQSKEPTTYYGD